MMLSERRTMNVWKDIHTYVFPQNPKNLARRLLDD